MHVILRVELPEPVVVENDRLSIVVDILRSFIICTMTVDEKQTFQQKFKQRKRPPIVQYYCKAKEI